MITSLRDIHHAARTLSRSPGFTAVAVLTLALGIGANTAIFSVVEGVLLRPLPYPDPDELVQVRHVHENGSSMLNFSFLNYADVREQSRSFDALTAWQDWNATVTDDGGATRVGVADVTAGFFDAMDVEPAIGRRFAPDEFGPSGAAIAVVGHEYWRGRLGGDPDLSNATVRMGGRAYRVVGVMPEGFDFPGGTGLWLPTEASAATQSRTGHNFQVVGRLADDVTLEQARGEVSAIARRLKATHGDDTNMSDALVVPLREELVGSARPALLVMLGAAAFLLLVACANIVNLLLARNAARQRELSVRLALGAGRTRLARRFLTESLLLALAGGALGVWVAVWGVPALLALEPGALPRLDFIGLNWAVLLFALGVSVLAAAAMGVIPALRASRGDLRTALVGDGRTQTGDASSHRLRRGLAVSQIALTLVLLVGAGLLARSFMRLVAVDPGYRTSDAVVMDLWLPFSFDAAGAERAGLFHGELLDRLRAIPGVEAAGGVDNFPLTGGGPDGSFFELDDPDMFEGVRTFEELQQRPELLERATAMWDDPERSGYAEFRVAGAGYFRTMEIPLLRGRLFDERDGPNSPHVAVISESLAESRWPDEDPIGRVIEFGNMDGDPRPFTIVGIVGDTREASLTAEPRPTFYAHTLQRPRNTLGYHVVMRGSGDAAATIASARSAARELNPEVALRFRTLDQIFSTSLAEQRFTMLVLGVFGATALLLAMIGIYGVVSYLASLRTREMGIRLALGARTGDVLRLLLGQAAGLAVAGVALGILAALGLTRLLGGLVYEVGTLDPATFVAVALLLGGVATLAGYVPARRAARVDPMVTLREE